MKKAIIVAVFAMAGLAAFAGTCVIKHASITTIGSHDTYAAQLQNDSGANILQHNFAVAFLDANNKVLEIRTVPGCLRSLQNGASDFYSAASTMSSSSTNNAISRIAFDSSFKLGTTAAGDVTISNLAFSRTGKSLKVTGKITNNDSDKLFNPVACIVVLDDNEDVILVARTSDISDLAEGGSDTFSITVTVPDDSNVVDRVSVYVDGLDGADDGTPIGPETDTLNAVTVCEATATATNTTVPTNTSTATATPTSTSTPVGSPTPTNTPVPNTSTPTRTPCGG